MYATSFNEQGSRVRINRIHIQLGFTWYRFHFCVSTESYLRQSFKDGPSKICGRQSLKILNLCSVLADQITSSFLKAVLHNFCLVDS